MCGELSEMTNFKRSKGSDDNSFFLNLDYLQSETCSIKDPTDSACVSQPDNPEDFNFVSIMKSNEGESSRLEFDFDKENIEPNKPNARRGPSADIIQELEHQLDTLTTAFETLKKQHDTCGEQLRQSESKVKVLQEELNKQRRDVLEEKNKLQRKL